MRIVSASEAVSGIASGQQLYLQCAAATPSVLLDALVARAAGTVATSASSTSIARVRDRTSPPRWRPISGIGRCSSDRMRGRRSPRVGPTTSRPSCRTCRGCSTAVGSRSTRSSSTRPRPMPTASARSGRRSRRCTPRSGPPARSSSSSTRRCRGRSATASSTSSQIDLAVECDVPPYEHPVGTARRGRAADRRIRGRPRPRRGDPPARHRRDPGGHGARARRQARPRRPHRDVHRLDRRPGRGRASSPAPARSATAASW